eukprot:scaffold858_cov123-Cylindrotheca_fusiformis.AAC.12
MPLPLWKKAALVPALLFALWLLTDDETSESGKFHHLAVLTALNRHRPSLRVYRSLLELNLLMWGLVVSLVLWSRTIGNKMIGHLLFRPSDEVYKDGFSMLERSLGRYRKVNTEEIFNVEYRPEDSQLSEDEALDADYLSDGDVSEAQSQTEEYMPPSVEAVAGVALDSLILILISLFFFTFSSAEGGSYIDGMASIHTLKFIALVAAPVFPLLLFIGGVCAAVFPWAKRKEFWKVISLTIGAPFFHVTFRDGFVGDILTSSVRPMQDTAFTAFYFLSGLQGWWTETYNLDAADAPLETNWLLHTCILPMCMASPLWWRFLQNLSQCYENKKRWPYLGNALKYFIAAEVAMFGVFNPSRRQSLLWLSCFVGATLYQIWWDVFMDWELFEIQGGSVRLRKTRIYQQEWMYWAICALNFVLRFCWTLSFLPPHYLNRAGVLSDTFEGDLTAILSPTIASAEIIRRTFWGFLRVELEAIKVARKEPHLKGAWVDELDGDIELKLVAMDVANPIGQPPVKVNELQLLGELSLYATAFTSLGLLAAAHRVTY